MKKLSLTMMVLLCSVAICTAQGFKIGGHGAYTVGGDVEDEQFGAGAQIGIGNTEGVSLELAGTWVQDEVAPNNDLDIFTIALTIRLGTALGEGVDGYIGGGADYNTFNIEQGPDPDDEAGYHGCAGLEFDLGENLQLFGEYRYTWVEYTVQGNNLEDLTQDYEFGLARVGLNITL